MCRFGKIRQFFLLLLLPAGAISGNLMSIVGNWQTIDHETNKPSSVIRIWEHKGKYFGKVVRSYHENHHQSTDRCRKCPGDLYNKPILGMTIISELVADDEKGRYVGGTILDPTSGKFYHCRMTVADQGRQLKVRGYIGFPLLGRTDIWFRVVERRHR